MKVKTQIKVGSAVSTFLNESERAVKQTGQLANQAVQSAAKTVTSRKFWLWPW